MRSVWVSQLACADLVLDTSVAQVDTTNPSAIHRPDCAADGLVDGCVVGPVAGAAGGVERLMTSPARCAAGCAAEGVRLLTEGLAHQRHGQYQVQAVIAALHNDAASAEETDWPQIPPPARPPRRGSSGQTLTSVRRAPAPARKKARNTCR